MQSYRHICTYPEEDMEFKERKIEINKCSKYKEIVNNQSCVNNLNKYSYPLIMKLIGYQVKKTNYILNNKYSIPDINNFRNIDLNSIYKIQCKNNQEKQWIYVLNTFVFHLIEFNPKIILENIKRFD